MNIKDFLIDNYIWIIVILLITIITIIGFLADKKKGDKNKDTSQPANSNMNAGAMNNPQPMQYQQINGLENTIANNNQQQNYVNPMPPVQNNIAPNIGNVTVQPVVTEPTPVPVNVVPTNNMSQMNNPMPVENVIPQVEQESMYQPLSEQKPMIAPQSTPSFGEAVNNIQQPVNQNTPQNIVPTPINMIPGQINNSLPMAPEPMINQMPNYNVSNNIPQMVNDNVQMVSSMNQNVTIPQPMNPTTIPTPQPVQPQPIITESYNNQQTMSQPNYNQPMPQSHIENTVNQSSQPINFVYGPQNNNQNM
ncbi:MAG: hypothetical protein IJE89_00020 [Bacilli bacterium]|nr:hypothetical protein [Bacilli bacterium]